MSVRFVRQAQSHATDWDAEGLEKSLGRGVESTRVRSWRKKVSGSRPGCP